MPEQQTLIDPNKPPEPIVTRSEAEFYEACAKAKRGEIVVDAIEVGKTNGEWIFKLRKQHAIQTPA